MQHRFLLHSPTEVGFFIRGLTVCCPKWREQGLQPQPDPGNRWCPQPKLSPHEDVLTTPRKCCFHISCCRHQRRPSGSSPSCVLCLVSEGLPAQYETPTGKNKNNWWKRAINCQVLYRAGMWNRKETRSCSFSRLLFMHCSLQCEMHIKHELHTQEHRGSGAGGKALQGGWGESTVGKQSRMF